MCRVVLFAALVAAVGCKDASSSAVIPKDLTEELKASEARETASRREVDRLKAENAKLRADAVKVKESRPPRTSPKERDETKEKEDRAKIDAEIAAAKERASKVGAFANFKTRPVNGDFGRLPNDQADVISTIDERTVIVRFEMHYQLPVVRNNTIHFRPEVMQFPVCIIGVQAGKIADGHPMPLKMAFEVNGTYKFRGENVMRMLAVTD